MSLGLLLGRTRTSQLGDGLSRSVDALRRNLVETGGRDEAGFVLLDDALDRKVSGVCHLGRNRRRDAERLGELLDRLGLLVLEAGGRHRLLDLDVPARKLRRQAHVLSALADRERILVGGHDDMHRVGQHRIDLDRLELGRRESTGDVLADILVPADNVDLLAGKLGDDRPYAAAALADASADGIDVLVGRPDRELGAVAGVAGDAHDLDHAVGDFGNLKPEERLEELAARTAKYHARTLRLGIDPEDDRADGVAHLVVFAGNALAAGEDHLRLADGHISYYIQD